MDTVNNITYKVRKSGFLSNFIKFKHLKNELISEKIVANSIKKEKMMELLA